MAYYLPEFRPQRDDPTEPHIAHENNNCTMTSGAMCLEYQTQGRVKVWGGTLRHRQYDQDGGTGLDDLKVAWATFGETLHISVLHTWSAVLARLAEGRMVILQGDSGDLDSSCSEVQDVAHAIAVHPHARPGFRLSADPWCRDWKFLPESQLRTYASKLNFQFAFTKILAELPEEPEEVGDIVPTADTKPRLLNWSEGTTLYDLNGKFVSTYKEPRTNVYSPFMATADRYAVSRTYNGATQLGYISKAQAKGLVVRDYPEDCSQEIAADRLKAYVAWKP